MKKLFLIVLIIGALFITGCSNHASKQCYDGANVFYDYANEIYSNYQTIENDCYVAVYYISERDNIGHYLMYENSELKDACTYELNGEDICKDTFNKFIYEHRLSLFK